MRTTRRIMTGLVAAALVVGACGDDDTSSATTTTEPDDDNGGGTPDVELVQADLPREEPAADAPVDEVAAGIRDFALAFAATEPDGNLVISPTSMAVAFAMAEAGAADPTAAQIAEVFGFPPQPGVHEAMNALTTQFDEANREAEDPADQVTLELANAVWGQSGIEFGQSFLDTLATQYGTGVETTDFRGDPEGSRQAINDWVSEITRERISELVPEGMITEDQVAMLVNAIYLKAAWEQTFDEEATSDEPFHLVDGSSPMVPTMFTTLHAAATDGEGYVAVELPYVGGELSMVVILPDEGTALRDFETGLDGERLGQIMAGLAPIEVELAMPRWQAESALDLSSAMTSLGLPIPGGDMRGIAPDTEIGAAVHAANITVDENGTEAAAATAIGMEATAAPPGDTLSVRVDRPFLFLVQHRETGTPLFYGRITDPRG